MKKYCETKALLAETVLDSFPQAEGDEIEAIVSHWLQSPFGDIPFLTASIRDHCQKHFNPQEIKKIESNVVCEPDAPYQQRLPIDWNEISFPPIKSPAFTFIDLFAGIGGFRIAMQELKGKCVFSSEWDPYSKKTYELNFGEVPFGDIRKIPEDSIPEHDVLCAGFPCQPFSLAGFSARNSLDTAHGFACETQGTLF